MSALVRVVFVGGPSHGLQVLMSRPEFEMAIEDSNGALVEYCRRMVETLDEGGEIRQVATYSPTGLSEHDFDRLALHVAARTNDLSDQG